MSHTPELSEARRALLEKYLRGDIPQDARAGGVAAQQAKTEVADPRARVVGVQVEGTKQPFFFLHGNWKGTTSFCSSLAHELGSDQPFYALEAYRFDGLAVPPTVEAMAAAHIRSMRAVQPGGPYLLGGWCNGGLVAYEMARQLHAVGQMVDLLVLMDPMYLGYRTRRKCIRGILSRLGDLMGLDPEQQLDWFLRLLYVCKPLHPMMHALLHVYRSLRNARYESSQGVVRLIINDVFGFARQNVMVSIKRFTSMFEHKRVAAPRLDSLVPIAGVLRQDYLGIFEWIDMGYKPADLYSGKITFLWPANEPWHTVSGGWRKVAEAKEAQDVEVYVISGNQDTWRTEHLHALGERLRMGLSKAQKDMI